MTNQSTQYPANAREQSQLFEQIIEAGRSGKSHAQIAKLIGISRANLNAWLAEHVDFAKAMEQADDYALAWWEALGQRHAETREGNATMIMFVMKNRFEQDYGKEAAISPEAPPNMGVLTELSPKTRQKLRKLLRASSEENSAP